MRRLLGILLCYLMIAGTAPASDTSPLRTLMTGDDSRGWQAVGRLNFGLDSFCTGSLIAEDLVLTAAHCLFDKETGAPIPLADIQFLADLRGGRASAYRSISAAVAHPSFVFEERASADRILHDVALLRLSQPIRSAAIVPFETRPRPRKGAEVGVVSYAHDRADSPALQEICHVLARQSGTLVLSCDVDFGSSGAPIFIMEDGYPRIVSVVSAKAYAGERQVALGTGLESPLSDLMELIGPSSRVVSAARPSVLRLGQGDAGGNGGAKFLRP